MSDAIQIHGREELEAILRVVKAYYPENDNWFIDDSGWCLSTRTCLGLGEGIFPLHGSLCDSTITIIPEEWTHNSEVAKCLVFAGLAIVRNPGPIYCGIVDVDRKNEIGELFKTIVRIFDGYQGCRCTLEDFDLVVQLNDKRRSIRIVDFETPYWMRMLDYEAEFKLCSRRSKAYPFAEVFLAIFRALPWIAEAIRLSK